MWRLDGNLVIDGSALALLVGFLFCGVGGFPVDVSPARCYIGSRAIGGTVIYDEA